MNSLIRNRDANAHKPKVNGHEIDIVKYITTQSPMKGPPELVSCQIALGNEGFWYFRTIARQPSDCFVLAESRVAV
jgi:hypothetical protein